MSDPLAIPRPQPGGIAARARAGAGAPYLDALNPEQRKAVETLDGAVLVLAGAGTGKTRVLTTRIAHILHTGRARPSEILAVTFTNRAAREMKERIGLLVGHAVEGMPWLGTFHSIGVRILRRHAEMVGLKPNFTILDTDDQIRLLKQLIAADNIDEKRWPARALATLIDGWKNRGLTPKDVPPGEGAVFADGRGFKLYKAYQERLKTLNAADFGDLLIECIRLFREQPDVLRQFQQRFRYILVDEYQDTNVAQYLWLRLLAQRPRGQHVDRSDVIPGRPEGSDPESITTDNDYGFRARGLSPAPRNDNGVSDREQPNICCVGDDDQSIYGWRGAEVDNILRFDKDFPGATIIRLETNYRSTGHILAVASALIAHNKERLGKTLRTDAERGEKVTVTGVWDSEEEARSVGDEIEALQRHGHSLDEMAILVRASFQMRSFEDRFITLGLPYRVIGGPRFYERAEIRDALAYLRCVASPADDLAFERIVNVPRRGLGDATLQIVHDHARRAGIPMIEAVRALSATEELKAKPRNALRSLILSLDRWREQRDSIPHFELAEIILDESGYTEMWQKDRTAEAAGRLENLKELVRSMQDFENLQGFLEHISLVMDKDRSENAEAVSIMTLHSAKGLEFDTVFLPGWEEGLFPHQRALDDQGLAGLEEERRLAHVGVTRARRRAKIYFATNRRIHGLWQTTAPSRFLDELPEADVEVIESRGGAGGYGGYGASRFDAAQSFGSNYSSPGWRRAQSRSRGGSGEGGFSDDANARWHDDSSRSPTRSPPPSSRSDFPSPARGGGSGRGQSPRTPLTIEGELVAKSTGTETSFSIGDRVFHVKFGNGNVRAIEGNKLTINFDQAGEKRVVDSFVERV